MITLIKTYNFIRFCFTMKCLFCQKQRQIIMLRAQLLALHPNSVKNSSFLPERCADCSCRYPSHLQHTRVTSADDWK